MYSYAMTYNDILIGHIPFFGYEKSDWKKVIDGERPYLFNYVDPRLQEMVERCWHKEPTKTPTLEVILTNGSSTPNIADGFSYQNKDERFAPH